MNKETSKETMGGGGHEFRDKAKEQWGKPTNDRLDLIAAKLDQLEGEIQQLRGACRGAPGNGRRGRDL